MYEYSIGYTPHATVPGEHRGKIFQEIAVKMLKIVVENGKNFGYKCGKRMRFSPKNMSAHQSNEQCPSQDLSRSKNAVFLLLKI